VDSVPSDGDRDGAAPVAPFRPARRVSTTGTIAKIVSLGLLNGLVIWALPRMFDKPDYAMAIAAILATLAIDIVYLSPRRLIPYKYLLPGTLFLLAFAVYPILNTVYLSTTNYGTGNLGTKDDAIATIERNSIGASDESPRYDLQVLAEGDAAGPIAYLLTDADGNTFLGTADGLTPVAEEDLIEDGRRQTIAGYEALNLGAVQDRAAEIDAFVVPTDQGDIVNQGFTEAVIEIQRRTYDPELDAIVDVDGPVYEAADGYFVSEDGAQRLSPGWRYSVGLGNYVDLFTDPRFYEPMARVLAWTMFFALASVVTTFAVGLLLAMVFNAPMRGKRLYRGLIVIPYAIPSFMTALIWRGMFNRQFGVINEWLGTNLNWLGGQWLPYLTILIVNLWLGYPYMFLVCTGALQGIPDDYVEAARVDGATGLKAFRTITFPLLLIAVAPLLIASFAYNFNNFNLIFLLTEGRPPVSGSDAGRTDILISYTYKLAFFGARGQDFGFAAAVSVVVFMLVAGISAFGFRFTKAFEEVR
jgi:arabinogalactan oligomer/maltooligosaccharide transport system permease protein